MAKNELEEMEETHLAEMQAEEELEFEFDLNEAAIYFDDDTLVVSFGEGRTATMEIEDDHEREIVRSVLGDVNTWAMFLTSLSAALKQHA